MSLNYRMATIADADLYYIWTLDPDVRKNSFNQRTFSYAEHISWFREKLGSSDTLFYLFFDSSQRPVGQVRVEFSLPETTVGISIDKEVRGRGYGVEMLKIVCSHLRDAKRLEELVAYIKKDNAASNAIFAKAGFSDCTSVVINYSPANRLTKDLK